MFKKFNFYFGKFIFIIFLICKFSSCVEEPVQLKTLDENKLREPLILANKTAAEAESEQIDAFVKRHGWDVIKTGTGLRYFIYRKGEGEKAMPGQVARVNFEILLISGVICYSTEKKCPQEFLIGESEVESGLHEGITYMRVGDKAKIILPSHLAHGLAGDLNKIPPRSTIIYDIELVGLKDLK